MRPAWSAGTAYVPLAWHIKQSSRPSSVCSITVGVAAGGGGGVVGAGVVGGGVVGGGVGVPPHAASNGIRTSMATAINHTYFFMTCFTSLLL